METIGFLYLQTLHRKDNELASFLVSQEDIGSS